jgi:HEAT repeat protein
MSFLHRLFGDRKSTGSKTGKLSEESLPVKQAVIKPKPGPDAGMDPSIEVLHNSQSWEKRRDASTALANYPGTTRAFEALIHAMKHDSSWVVRFSAAAALGGFGEVAVEPLIAALEDQEKSVIEYAAKSLGRIRDERGIDPLIKTLAYKGDYAPVSAAREALVEFGSEAVPMLLSHTGDENIHDEVVRALAAIGDIRAAEVLFSVAKNAAEKTYIRIHAVRGLGQLTAFDSAPALLEMLSETNENKLVEALLESLKKLMPGVDITAAALNAKRRGLEKYLADLKSIVPGMSENVAQGLSGAHSYFQAGANIVCNTKFGNFQLVVGGDKRVISTLMLEHVIKEVETALGNLEGSAK